MSDSETEVEVVIPAAGEPPSPPVIVDGDWICGDAECKNVNFARRTACNRCNKERVLDAAARKKLGTEIGKAAADKSRGLFSAEDWQCSKCANVNWARRNTCNMCNAPKFTDVEERTGYGGGYNDRGVVEYKEHREASDDEYDEFGRRKKKREHRNSSLVGSKPAETIRRKSIERKETTTKPIPEKPKRIEDDDDDDDEDDDDADLSKYDLWGDDDGEESTSPKKSELSTKARDTKSHAESSTSSSGSSSSSSSRNSRQLMRNAKRSRSRSRSRSRPSKSSLPACRSKSRTREVSRANSGSSSSTKPRSQHSNKRRSRSRSRSPSNHRNGHSKFRSRRSRSRSRGDSRRR